MKLLTKSKYLAGLQCPKLLWTLINEKEIIPEVDSSTQKIFDTGTQIGILATSLFTDGIKVTEKGFIENINETKKLLNENKPLFEAGFMINGLFSRADILVPNNNGWDIIEVKSSTEVKDVNIHDVSFQKHVYELCGLKINKCYLMYINNKYVRNGEINVSELFIKEDITNQVNEFIIDIETRINDMKQIIKGDKPLIDIGPYCSEPYTCSLIDICWNHLPGNNVFTLTRGGKKSWELYKSNILHIKDIPGDFKLSDKQQIQRECEIFNRNYIDKEAIKHFLKTIKYPIYYFDFETINPAIPLYDGMSPYKRIAFQYSLHIEDENGIIKHISFLADEKKDPREEILKSMKDNLGSNGTILAWNQSFEIGVIKELIEYYPSYRDWGLNILERFNDLIIPFKNYSYYNKIQKGSSSIKKVLPALTNLSYSDLEISNGSDASSFYEMICLNDLPIKEVQKIRSNLEKYCELDTLAEIEILKQLKKISK
jgi:hypothetical protein